MNQARVGTLAAATAALAFGTAPVATAFQLRSFDVVPAAMWRATVGALGLAAILLIRKRAGAEVGTMPRGRGLARLLVLGVLGGPVFLFGLNTAVSEVGASISGLVTGLYAVFAAAVAPFILKERLETSALTGLVLAMIGTVMLAALDVGGFSVGGLAAGVGAAVGYSLYLVLGRKWMDAFALPPDGVALSAASTTVVAFFGWLAVSDPGALWPDALRADALIALFWLGAVMAGGQTLVMMSARRIHSRRSAAWLLLNPVSAAVLGVAVLDESLSLPQVAGAVVVLAGLALGAGLGRSFVERLALRR